MPLYAIIAALMLAIPSADAAVIASTKQKKLPVIENVFVSEDLRSFGFDITKAPTTNAYDVWARITDDRGKILAEWFVRSMKFRRRNEPVSTARFKGNLADVLTYAGDGDYGFTLFGCPANLKKPKETACAWATETITYTTP